MSMLEVAHLKKYFTTQKAVDDISFPGGERNHFRIARTEWCR